MNNFNDDKLDKMLTAYCTRENETFTFTKPKKVKHTALIAACLVLVILAGIIFIPHLLPHKEHSFIIVANAQSLDEKGIASADEITKDAFVEFENLCGNMVFFDFNNKLNTNAREIDLVKTYLFQSFATNLSINVVGEDIETITYKPNRGAISLAVGNQDETEEMVYDRNHTVLFGYNASSPEYTINYDEHKYSQIAFNPVYDENAEYEFVSKAFSYKDPKDNVQGGYLRTDNLAFSEDSDALGNQYGWVSILGFGYRTNAASVVTAEEKKTLESYINADDMVGFFNFQNQIFKRLVDGTTIDVTVTFTSGETVTKTLELTYTPAEVTDAEYNINKQSNTPSNGTVSAKLK